MAHIKRIDLTRDVEAHAEAYRKAIENVCKETAFSGGKYADAFDKEFAAYVGSKFASGVNNGTSALHLAMLALGVGPGDEVIVPANTYIATAWGVSYTGATPVFADCTPDTWEIDPSVLEAKITEKTKGIIGVHLYGQPDRGIVACCDLCNHQAGYRRLWKLGSNTDLKGCSGT